jgi:plasmid stabilization system protein ParE
MKVIYTDEASEDLDRILAYIASNYWGSPIVAISPQIVRQYGGSS